MIDDQKLAAQELSEFVQRIERLEEEKQVICDDIKDVYGEAKGRGYDAKIIKKIIALRRLDEQERLEIELVLETYMKALGMKFTPDDEGSDA